MSVSDVLADEASLMESGGSNDVVRSVSSGPFDFMHILEDHARTYAEAEALEEENERLRAELEAARIVAEEERGETDARLAALEEQVHFSFSKFFNMETCLGTSLLCLSGHVCF